MLWLSTGGSDTLIFVGSDYFSLCLTKVSCSRKAKNTTPAFLGFELERTVMPEELKVNKDAPEVDFEIEHVYGYRAADCQ